jgi:transcriptional regulator with PAS, ATPase and Fis domain
MQLKLLRVLQEGEFERVGGTETIKVDVRIIAATNKDLEKAMKEGTFRQDLYYRLNVIPIYVPPLRERREDIKYLIQHFVDKFGKLYGKRIKSIDPKAMKVLEAYDYPGNIRELENLVERIIVLNKNNEITLADLPESIKDNSNDFSAEEFDFKDGLQALVERFERRAISRALEMNDNNKVKTAKMLAMNRSTFMSKIKKYSIG